MGRFPFDDWFFPSKLSLSPFKTTLFFSPIKMGGGIAVPLAKKVPVLVVNRGARDAEKIRTCFSQKKQKQEPIVPFLEENATCFGFFKDNGPDYGAEICHFLIDGNHK
jgi:hypothetical protein